MPEDNKPRGWSTVQVASIGLLCFAMSFTMGYLFHTPTSTAASAAGSSQAPATQQSPAQPSPEQLLHMAEKQAEPLQAKLLENPNDAAALAELGKTYLYIRDYQKSASYYEQSVRIKPDPRVLTTLGGAYHLGGADDRAIDAWQRALKIEPGYADALYNLGLVKWQSQGDPAAAIQAWTTLLKANPNHPQRAKVEDM